MSGIRERRLYPPGTRPSTIAAQAGALAIEQAQVDKADIGLCIHSSVCRDFMEPATAAVVHARLGLHDNAQAFDLSNACLGFANAMVQAAALLEAGHMQAVLVVSGEDGGPLVQQTLDFLSESGATRKQLKAAFSSLTIGSGAVAAVLVRDTSDSGHRLLGATSRSATQFHELCSGGDLPGATGPLMETDSEALLHAGIALAKDTFGQFCKDQDLSPQTIDRVVTHQVSSTHRKMLLESLDLPKASDYVTYPKLGNVGSVSLPITLAMAAEEGFVQDGQTVAMLGIGSGLSCQMLSVRW